YLGRANGIYEAPRDVIKKLDAELVEMKSCKSKSLCCGAGGAQMFKEPEKGSQDINFKRSDEAINTDSKIVAVSCPFCNTMMNDGMTSKQKEIDVLDIAQMIEKAEDL
ncbi:MAG: (Fe-S)-binding protein, partial [Flavobacteriaceae bacterium]|nr:(Fe-S)-binding protein [Flavobacteriaceae bacterium]